ncbi:hypothetical protein CBF23_011035 [Marinomonas agarivorans]|nr:hypothetical protein CBF23_011035 [Marinomonas agarivorans]
MLYPILIEYYWYFAIGLLVTTWFCRQTTPETRKNLLYLYGFLASLGFLLAFDWMGGVIFGLLVLEWGRVLRGVLDRKADQLNNRKMDDND